MSSSFLSPPDDDHDHDANLPDGWGDEDDLELDDDDDDQDDNQGHHDVVPKEEDDDENLYYYEHEEEEEEEEEVVFHSTAALSSPSQQHHHHMTTTMSKRMTQRQEKEDVVEFADDLENTNHTPLDAWDFEDEDNHLDDPNMMDDDDEDDDDEGAGARDDPKKNASAATAPSSSPRPTIPSHLHQDDGDTCNNTLLYQELVQYVTVQLELLWPSMNAILDAEYNTIHHAQHLVQYYQQRQPQLATYTLEKELHRMQYQVQVVATVDQQQQQKKNKGHVVVLTNPMEITQYFSKNNRHDDDDDDDDDKGHDELLLLAASNQSLLADLLHVMTGPDRLIRSQYFATCLATSCQFHIITTTTTTTPTTPTTPTVTCQAQFELSLPCHDNHRVTTTTTSNRASSSSSSSSSSRLVVATFGATITFSPRLPMIHYQITHLNVILPPNDVPHALGSVALFLKDMMDMNDDMMMSESTPIPDHESSDADLFRDMFFLEQTQDFIKSQQRGVKSAWNQVNAVVNLQSKLDTVTNLMSTGQEVFMSAANAAAANVVAAAAAANMESNMSSYGQEEEGDDEKVEERVEEEEVSFHQDSERSYPQLAPSHHHGEPIMAFAPPPVRPPPPPSVLQPPPPHRNVPMHPPAARTTAAAVTSERPTSILGGFISRLAQSVAIPDEDDIYRKEYGFSTADAATAHHNAAAPSLYRREEDVPTRTHHPPHHHQAHHQQGQPQFPLPAPPSLGFPRPPSQPSAPPLAKPPATSSNSMDSKVMANAFDHRSHENVAKQHVLPHEDVEVVQDGWDDVDDELLLDDDDDDNHDPPVSHSSHEAPPTAYAATTAATTSVAVAMNDVPKPSRLVTIATSYNPEDDIIETRKRWVNPRPGTRQITI
jgi:hypothetical protein